MCHEANPNRRVSPSSARLRRGTCLASVVLWHDRRHYHKTSGVAHAQGASQRVGWAKSGSKLAHSKDDRMESMWSA